MCVYARNVDSAAVLAGGVFLIVVTFLAVPIMVAVLTIKNRLNKIHRGHDNLGSHEVEKYYAQTERF